MSGRIRRWSTIFFLVFLSACTRAEKLELGQLKLPAGFHISIFAHGKEPRLMTFSPGGVLLVSDTSENKIFAFPDPRHIGHAEAVVVTEKLREPQGIAFHNGKLYVAETNQVRRYDWDEATLKATNGKVIAKLPEGGGHSSRTIVFHQDKMYVSAGSSCNLCVEEDPRRATVMRFHDDGTGQEIFAHGARNTVGMAVSPKTDTIWGTDNGRDMLGDDLPPDKINNLGTGGDFGWPYCYGNRIPDPWTTPGWKSKGGKLPGAERCKDTIAPKVELQAHSAPLGLAFYSGNMFPAEYRGDLFVALHGSWNRSVPTGYKVIRVRMDEKGEPKGVEDFITGWLKPGETKKGVHMGRPVGIAFAADGSMYVSDDAGGVIYRVTWER
jgi:glucose/arabinose dehydrogenase